MKKKTLFIIIGIGVIVLLGIIALLIWLNPFKNKIIPSMNKIEIEYVPGMNYSKAKEMNETETTKIEVQKIKLSDQEQNKVKKQINKIKEKIKKSEFEILYKIVIDKDNTLYLGKEIGNLQSKDKTTYFEIPTSLYQTLKELEDKNNDNILTKLSFEKFTIKKAGAGITLTNKDNIKIVKNALPYYKITLEADYSNYDEGYKATLYLDDDITIYLYSNNIGYIKNKDEAFYVIFPYNLEDAVNSIYNISVK